jgi:Ca-activated chloride channel family protein
MRFDSPEFLLLLPIAIWFWRGSRHGGAPLRRGLRCAASLCLILALGGMQVRGGESPLAVMFVLDRSESVAGTAAASLRDLNALTAAMRAGDRAGLIVFGAEATIERPVTSHLSFSTVATALSGTSTNIQAALRLAQATLPPDGARRIVLVSDGNETVGDAAAESTLAADTGVPIDVVVPPAEQTATPIDVMRVTAPHTVRIGDPFVVVVTARGIPDTRGTISMTGPGGESWSARVTLASDGLATAAFSTRSADTGLLVYEASARADRQDDFDLAPRRAGAVVAVAGETRILYVGDSTRLLGPSLTRAGFRLQHIAAESLPRSVAALGMYDGIVFDDIAPDRLDRAQATALAAHVQQHGGGLLFLGGRDSLEAGLLAAHPIGDLLPVDVRPRRGQRAPAMGLVVAFDKSGSMDDRVDGVSRMEFARQAVRRVFDAVPASDAVGVLAFDSSPHEVAPLGAGHDMDTVVSSLAAVQASGPTAIAPALELADQWLRVSETPTHRRHVLLVSDGRTSGVDIARARAILAQGGFELSVVALGADADRRLLETLARSTGGRAFFPNDIRDLPALVAREAARVSGERLFEAPFRPVARAHPVVAGVAQSAWPQLGGYVVGVAKASAESPLVSALDDPILATWRTGLGRVAVYTAELHAAWSQPLRNWDGFDALVTQTMRWVSRAVRDDALYVSFDEDDRGLRVLVEAQRADGTLLNELDAHAVIRTPTGETTSVVLSGVAPGRYEARIKGTEPGAYALAISAARPNEGFESRIVRGIYWSADREFRATGPNRALLGRVAAISGGRVLGVGDSPFAAPRTRVHIDAWPWLTAVALALFLAEVLLPVRWGMLVPWRRRDSSRTQPETAAA